MAAAGLNTAGPGSPGPRQPVLAGVGWGGHQAVCRRVEPQRRRGAAKGNLLAPGARAALPASAFPTRRSQHRPREVPPRLPEARAVCTHMRCTYARTHVCSVGPPTPAPPCVFLSSRCCRHKRATSGGIHPASGGLAVLPWGGQGDQTNPPAEGPLPPGGGRTGPRGWGRTARRDCRAPTLARRHGKGMRLPARHQPPP